ATEQLRWAIESAAQGDARIRLELREIGDDELQLFLNAADLVVLPYERVLNSGSALLALSFGRPVLVPRTGPMADLQAALGDGAVRLYSPPLSSDQLRDALATAAPDPAAVVDRLRMQQDWAAIADRTISLYQEAAA